MEMVSSMRSIRRRMGHTPAEGGFTLVELLAVVALMTIVLSLSVVALRHFWFVQSLNGAVDATTAQMRQAQQAAESESHPIVFGVWFVDDTTRWGTLEWDPALSGTDRCLEIGERNFDSGVRVQTVSFDEDSERRSVCRTALATEIGSAAANAQIAFFYARGTATSGSVTLRQTQLGRTSSLEVVGITGRVTQ